MFFKSWPEADVMSVIVLTRNFPFSFSKFSFNNTLYGFNFVYTGGAV